MGSCYKCGTELTLKDNETTCDNCGETINYICWNCNVGFDIITKENTKRLKECKWCGFFYCPNCNTCGPNCIKYEYQDKIFSIMKDIIPKENIQMLSNKTKEIVDYFEEIKLGKERKNCPFEVPISYAKNRIKSCLAKIEGYAKKNDEDAIKFKQRLQEIQNKPLGFEIEIWKEREEGNYGQELRDVCNLSVCLGELKIKIKKNKEGKEYYLYEKIEKGKCPYLIKKDIVIKKCPKCKKTFSKDKIVCPTCVYSKGKMKGLSPKLIIKTTNEDTCQLKRGDFKPINEIR